MSRVELLVLIGIVATAVIFGIGAKLISREISRYNKPKPDFRSVVSKSQHSSGGRPPPPPKREGRYIYTIKKGA